MKTHRFAHLLVAALLPISLALAAMGCQKQSKDLGAIEVSEPAVSVLVDAPLVPQARPDLAIYTARVDGESRTKVFAQRSNGGAPRLVYVDPEPGELVRVSDDGISGTYRRFIAPGVTKDIAVDFRKGESSI